MLDEFFTAKAKPNYPWEKSRRRKAYAKAIQFRINISRLNKAKRAKALRKLDRPDMRDRAEINRLKTSLVVTNPSNHHRSLIGFHKPRKMWHHRNSQHPGPKK